MKLKTGTIIFVLFAALSSCSKNQSFEPDTTSTKPIQQTTSTPDSTITDTTIFIDITLDGNRILRIENAADTATWTIQWGPYATDPTVYIFDRVGSFFVQNGGAGSPGFEFTKGRVGFHDLGGLPADFGDSFFAAGNYNYCVKTTDTSYSYYGIPGDTITKFDQIYTKTLLSDGVSLLWQDGSGTLWTTFKGSAAQTNSFFTITNTKPIMNGNTTGKPVGAIVTANFDCELYDGKGNSRHLTSGRFRQAVYY
jgi:hypothetical protein